MILTILLLCLFVYFVYGKLHRRYIPPVNSVVPTHPGKLPIVGHALQFLREKELFNVLVSIGESATKNGGVSAVYLGPIHFYVVTHADDVSTVLQNCPDKMFFYKFIEPLLGKMLVAADLPTWKSSRRIVDLSFKPNLLEEYLKLFKHEANRLVQALAVDVGKGEVDVTDRIAKGILETTCRTTMGCRVDGKDLVNDKYVAAVDDIMEILVLKVRKPWYLLDPIFKLSGYKQKMEEGLNIFFGLTEKMFQIRKEEHLQRLKNKEDSTDNRFRSFLDILLENSISEAGSVFTDQEMRNLSDNVLVAAFDTLISEMIMTLVCLGSRPDVQDKIHEEIVSILGENGEVTTKNIGRFEYLEAVVKEAIRLYPIGLMVAREAGTEVKLRNYTLPAGSNIVLHLWGVNRHPEFWGLDADEYKPERWFRDTITKNPGAFASFSPGKRGCPGKPYTLMYFKATLVPLLRRYKLKTDLSKLKVNFKIMLKPEAGHLISFENR